jgi:hypothetical protein
MMFNWESDINLCYNCGKYIKKIEWYSVHNPACDTKSYIQSFKDFPQINEKFYFCSGLCMQNSKSVCVCNVCEIYRSKHYKKMV